jgi:hypothetical protein
MLTPTLAEFHANLADPPDESKAAAREGGL